MNAPHFIASGNFVETELQTTLAELQKAHRQSPFPDWATRKQRLNLLEQMLKDNREALKKAISDDFGHRSHQETELLEIFPSLEGIRHARKHGKQWMKARRKHVSIWFRPASCTLMPQPLGVVGIMVPWNYPLFLTIGPLTAAITAGNRSLIKLSEFTPRFGELLGSLLEQTLGRDVVRVVNGNADVAATFSGLPFDHLLFTGSTPVGKHVMRAASANLVPVTLELGGKSPAVITPETCRNDSRFFHAVNRILAGKTLNAGQTCIAPDYVLLPKDAIPKFIAVAKTILSTRYPEGAASDDYTGIVADKHFDRLKGLLQEAADRGAQITPLMDPAMSGQRKLPLATVVQCPEDARLMQEEIFGPALPLIASDTHEDMIDYINDRPRPLAMYLFDDSSNTHKTFMEQTIAGGVSINETLMHIAQDDLPFGGVGPSGMGHYHGVYGFETMSKLKPIFKQSRINGMPFLAPPYGGIFKSMLKLMIR